MKIKSFECPKSETSIKKSRPKSIRNYCYNVEHFWLTFFPDQHTLGISVQNSKNKIIIKYLQILPAGIYRGRVLFTIP